MEDQLYRLSSRRHFLEGNWKTLHEILLFDSRIPFWPDPTVVNSLKISIWTVCQKAQVG